MRIASLETFVVGNPPPSNGGRYFVFLKLTTDDGVTGVGEVYAATFHPRTVEVMIADVFDRHVAGADPFHVEALWRRVYSRGYTARPDVSLVGVLSGIEMACWDIVGKAVGKPVYELLGGRVHERLRAYTYLYVEDGDRSDVYTEPTLAAERAAAYAARGFTALKFDPLWLEEPVPPESPEEMACVARATSIPIATGERLTTKYEFSRILATGAAAILQPNLGRVGGLLEGKKIAGMAEAHYVQIAPHLYSGPVLGAANIQLATCSPNFLLLEGILDWGGFHAEILRRPIAYEDGFVIPPTEPGLGVELDEEVARAHPYDGDELHLVPLSQPAG